MKQILHKACLTMLLFVVGVCSAWAENVEVTSFTDVSGTLGSYISYEAAKGAASTAPAINGGEIRVYQSGGLFTVSAKNNATITEIIIGSSMATKVTYAVDGGTASSEKSITANGKLTVSSINASNNVVFTCKGTDKSSRLYVNYLKVTYTIPEADAFTVTFNAGTKGVCSITELTEESIGSGLTLPSATANAGYAFIGWSTDAEPTSANAGEAGETYHPLSDCTLYAYYTVARPANEVFYESFDTNDGTGGNDGQWSGSIASNKFQSDNSWTTASASGASQCAKFGAGSALGSAQTPAIAASGSFVLTFKAAAWNGNSESTTLKLSATGATLSASSVTLTKGAWETYTINITNATEGFTIKFAGNSASNSRFFLDEVSIVSAATLSVSSVGYATYYNEAAYVMPEGLVGKIMQENQDESISSMEAYTADGYKIVPANTALLIKGEPGNYVLAPTSEKGDADYDALIADANLLRGSLTDETTTGGSKYYKFANDPEDGLGWYWGAADGAAFTNPAHKAYLAIPEGGNSPRFISIENETPTAIESINANTNTEIYDLAGRRVNNAANGLYIVNGKKVIR